MSALISVSDKTGVVEFAKGLRTLGWEVIATGGTMKLLADSGVEVINISDVTGFPEICDGRVKTLNPKIHAGILARRPVAEHMAALEAHAIDPIDLVVVNLYPFEQTVAKPDCTFEDAVENIDIWGRRKLAYEIAGKTEGNYVVVNYSAEPATSDELDRLLNLNESVIHTKILRK